jgi:hypothetical protein
VAREIQGRSVDRQAGHNPYVLALSCCWNEARAMIEERKSLTKVLVAGGPVEETLELPDDEKGSR